ncbi:MAG: SIMPL domain-containing protein [Firmicutes bacterium]|nr:SIMPL domain-containing protein [Bacillota bacterium]
MKNFKPAVLAVAGLSAATLLGVGLMNMGILKPGGAGASNAVYAAETSAAPGAGKGEINVSGTGSVNINPDVAYMSLGVSTQNADAKDAMDENSRLIAAVIGAVKAAGVAEKDIRTDGFSMYPTYDYSNGVNNITGYSVSNNVTVTVRDIASVGAVLGAAADAGANVAGGVQFGVLDNSAAYNDALALAIENAAGKARTIAKSLNLSIGSPVSVTESSGGYPAPLYTGALNSSVANAAGNVPVQTGKLTVTANVSVTYEYAR